MDVSQQPLSLPGASAEDSDAPLPLAGTAVALFHGFTSGPHSVTPWAQALAAAGAQVEVPLLPGHGTRWEDLETVTVHDLRAAARDTVDDLLLRHRQVAVGGLSMGGALALDAAAHRPVRAAVVVNPALRFSSPAAPFAPALRHLVRSVAPIADDAVRPGVQEHAYPRTPVAGVAQLGRLQAAVRRGLHRIEAPVLAFASRTDHVVPARSVTTLAQGLPEGLLTVRPLYNSFHVATLDWDAPLIHEESVRFLAARAQGRRRRR